MTRTSKGLKVWVDQRVGQYPYKRKPSNRIFRPGNAIGARTDQSWLDPSCPFSPFVRNSGLKPKTADEKDEIKENLKAEAKSRLIMVNYQRPLPLEPEFPEPEILCSKRRHGKVTRRNRFVREYLVRNPSMEIPNISIDQPVPQEQILYYITKIAPIRILFTRILGILELRIL